MTLTIELSPLLQIQLASAAQHNGLAPDAYVLKLLENSVTEEGAARVKAMFARWNEEDAVEQRETSDALIEALNAAREGERQPFPADLKGTTW